MAKPVCWLMLALLAGCGRQPAPPPDGQSHDPPPPAHAAPTGQESAMSTDAQSQQALFAAGCFWGVEYVFQQVPGVLDTQVGYTGGTVEKPTYQQVCTDTTGHAEAVLVTFDPARVSYAKLVDYFFQCHDPTQVNRQGPDVGRQYRSAIFYFDDQQRRIAEQARQALQDSGRYDRPIATSIEPAGTFWPAEDYHQDYIQRTGKPICHTIPPELRR